jgi:excisionase family DNA binding protein
MLRARKEAAMDRGDRLLTVPEVAERVRATSDTVRHWLRQGKLKGRRLGGDRLGWRISESDLDRFIAGEPSGEEKAS